MMRGAMAATALAAAVLGLMVGSVQGNEEPTVIYNITGTVQEDIYNSANLSAVMFSDDFNYTTVAALIPTSINSSVINAQNGPSDNKIVLRLPNGDEFFSVIAEYFYLGPPDDTQAVVADTSLLLMTGFVDGVRDLNLAEDHTFHWFLDTASQTIEGGVVMGESFYKFETVGEDVLITQFPVDDGLCRFRKGNDGPDPRRYNEAREARKAARRAEKELKRLNRKEARQEKREQKQGADGRRALAVEEQEDREEEEEEEGMMGNADLHDGHNHHHHHHHHAHAAYAHDHGLEHRQLQTVGLLIFLDLAPVSGVYQPWNGGTFITVTACPTTVTVGLLPALISAVREDFAPFNVDVTSNPAVYAASTLKKVRVILAKTATGILSGNTCGVAYLNSLNWGGNTVWAGCVCGDAVLAQTITHEVGHILNLRHDGTITPAQPYLFGLPSTLPSNRRWNAIMGGAAVVGLDQWSRGQYPSANNQQDDVALIRNLIGTRPSTVNAPAGCTIKLPYRDLTTVSSAITTTYPQSAITCESGQHQYPVRIRGRYTVTVSPVAETNLRFQVQIFRAVLSGGQWVTSGTGTTLGANDAYSSTSVVYTVPSAVATGNYIFRITAIAQPTATNTYAFPAYGSMGFYTMSLRNGF